MGLLWPDLGLELAASSFGSRRARAASRIVRFLVNDFSLALASVGDRTILRALFKEEKVDFVLRHRQPELRACMHGTSQEGQSKERHHHRPRAKESNVPVFNLHPQAAVLERGCSCH